jgi:DNA-binding Lrp family transcriptional regulator
MSDPSVGLNDTDRKIIGCLRESGRATAHEISRELDLDYGIVRRALAQLLESQTVRITALVDPTLIGHPISAFLWLRSQSLENELAVHLARSANVRWAAMTSDQMTAVVQASSGSVTEHLQFLDAVRAWPGVADLRSEIVLRSYIGPQSASMFRNPARIAATTNTLWLGKEEPVALDSADRSVIEILRADGRASLTYIAKTTGLPLSTTRRRVSRLLDSDGVRLQCRIAPELLGYRFHVGVSVRVANDSGGLARTLSSMAVTAWSSEITGRYAVTAELFATTQSEVDEALLEISEDPRVADVEIEYYGKNVKNTGLW